MATLFSKKEEYGHKILAFFFGCIALVAMSFVFFTWVDYKAQINTIEKIVAAGDEMIPESKYLECGENFSFSPEKGYFNIESKELPDNGIIVITQGELSRKGTYKKKTWAIAEKLPVTVKVEQENCNGTVLIIVEK
ncbi:MAG: hypothetical protein KAS07_02130 [Candidatus Pacebacteria bacterium]|nr:hypothetical protein [Candidatus Paceibacterota bacterium]